MRGKGDFIRLERMRDQCGILIGDLDGESVETFADNRLLYDATVMRLFTIGEDVAHLSEATLELAPAVEWHKIRGLRNVIAHGYAELDPARVWDIAVGFVPSFRKEVERLLSLVPRPPLGDR